MTKSFNKNDAQAEDVRQIPKWTRRYAQNRSMPFVVYMGIFLLLYIAIGVPSYLGGKTFRSGNILAFGICMFFLVIECVAVVCFSIPKWGGKLLERISNRLCRSEGVTTLPVPERVRKRPWVSLVVGLIFGSCVLASVTLGLRGHIPVEYMQPVSALYVVPFLVFTTIWLRPMIGLRSLLWPFLYSVHAILVVAGAPIQFTGPWQALNMLIPIAGYGILSALIAHVYSRYALKRLKKITLLGDGATDGT